MNRQGNDLKTFGEKLGKSLHNEDARGVYADTVTNAFVAAQIKALREDRGFSQEQLAELIGTKQSGVSRLERADYSSWKVETLRKLARAFRVRLRIRFEGFGSLLDEIGGFDNRNLLPPKFEDDPAFKEQANEDRGAAATATEHPSVPPEGLTRGEPLPSAHMTAFNFTSSLEFGARFKPYLEAGTGPLISVQAGSESANAPELSRATATKRNFRLLGHPAKFTRIGQHATPRKPVQPEASSGHRIVTEALATEGGAIHG